MIAFTQNDPERARPEEIGQVTPDGMTQCGEVERVGEAAPERHELFELLRASPLELRLRLGGKRVGLHLLPLAVLMEDKDDAQHDERGNEIEAVPLLDFGGEIQQPAERLLENDHRAGNQAGGERRVVALVEKTHRALLSNTFARVACP